MKKSMKPDRRKILLIILLIAIAATLCFIWGNSLQSRAESTKQSTGLQGGLDSVGIAVPENLLRKAAHLLEFAALGAEIAILLRIIKRTRASEVFSGWAAGLFVAVADEALQLISGRSSEVKDVLIDFFGYSMGFFVLLLIALLIAFYREKVKSRAVK